MTQDQWMKAAERLIDAYGLNCAAMEGREESKHSIAARAALLAHLQQRPLPEDEASIPIQCKKCLSITNEGNGCEMDGCPVGVRPLPVREGTFAWHLAANGMDMADATGRIVGAIRHTMGDISAYHDGRLIGSYLTAALAKAAVQRAALGDIGA